MPLDNLAAAGAATTRHAAVGHRHIVLAQGIEQVHACGNAERALEGSDKNFHLVRSVFSGGKAALLRGSWQTTAANCGYVGNHLTPTKISQYNGINVLYH
jgi:hypothetical protein